MDSKKKRLMIGILFLMIISISAVVTYYWYNNTYYVSTEDSTVTADLVKAVPQMTGTLLELNVKEGQFVEKGQIIARQDMGSLADTSQDLSIVRAPISGIVVKKQGTVGEIVSPSVTIATLVDPSDIYVTANIEETKLENIKLEQEVDISIDKYDGEKFTGKVDSIGEAANAVFSVLPTSSTGTFTKVTQKIPVKIKFDEVTTKLQPGLNAVIKIHVK